MQRLLKYLKQLSLNVNEVGSAQRSPHLKLFLILGKIQEKFSKVRCAHSIQAVSKITRGVRVKIFIISLLVLFLVLIEGRKCEIGFDFPQNLVLSKVTLRTQLRQHKTPCVVNNRNSSFDNQVKVFDRFTELYNIFARLKQSSLQFCDQAVHKEGRTTHFGIQVIEGKLKHFDQLPMRFLC